jgi:tRNA modification GTPase
VEQQAQQQQRQQQQQQQQQQAQQQAQQQQQQQQQQWDTIFALSSGNPPCGVAVVRLSGPQADEVLRRLCPGLRQLPPPRHLQLADLHFPACGSGSSSAARTDAAPAEAAAARHPGRQRPAASLIDRALVARFPAPASFTGEACVELHLHGSAAAVSALFEALRQLRGGPLGLRLRPAEPGEFARRAFLGGKLDLTQVEGLADLLAAETQSQRLLALAQSGGAAGRRFGAWRGQLVRGLARLEAVIDFGEDEGLAQEVAEGVVPLARGLGEEIGAQLAQAWRGEATRRGLRVLLLGPPNSGKSSLLNVLAGEEVALVSPKAGTTRDALEVALQLAGHKVLLADSAGIRSTPDEMEGLGVARALQRLQAADLVVLVLDGAAAGAAGGAFGRLLDGDGQVRGQGEGEQVVELDLADVVEPAGGGLLGGGGGSAAGAGPEGAAAAGGGNGGLGGGCLGVAAKPCLVVLNKSDLWAAAAGGAKQQGGVRLSLRLPGLAQLELRAQAVVATSCASHAGIQQLVQELERAVAAIMVPGPQLPGAGAGAGAIEAPLVTRVRHRQLLQECLAALQRYEAVCDEVDLAAEELRAAATALGKLTGAVQVEEVLGAVFSEFCIGK